MQHRKCQEFELDRYDDLVHKYNDCLRRPQMRTAFCEIALMGKRSTKACFSPWVL